MKLGIIGLTNVGKTCLFNAMTGQEADTSNYMFGTTTANIGTVTVPDRRLEWLSDFYQPKKTTFAAIDFMDMPGLVKGASKGEGLGNKFLANIRQVDALVQVVRCFDDENVAHADGSVDPERDMETINLELIVSDIDIVERRIERAKKNAKGDKKFLAEAAVLERLLAHLEEGLPARSFACSEEELAVIRQSEVLSLMPMIYAANLSEDSFVGGYEEDPYYLQVRAAAERDGCRLLPICAELEMELARLEPEERGEFLEDLGIAESGLDRLIHESYDLLGLISFLTAGKDECRAWTVRKGSTAPIAAGKIHSDLQRGFIRAEVVSYEDLKESGSMAAAKTRGVFRVEGKNYVVQDGDILNILFNV